MYHIHLFFSSLGLRRIEGNKKHTQDFFSSLGRRRLEGRKQTRGIISSLGQRRLESKGRGLEDRRDVGNSSKNKANSLANLAKLWSPFDRRLVLSGVRVGIGDDGLPLVRKDHIGMQEALASAWAPVFRERPFDTAAAQTGLQGNADLHLGMLG